MNTFAFNNKNKKDEEEISFLFVLRETKKKKKKISCIPTLVNVACKVYTILGFIFNAKVYME